jgi:hypothetical protein
LSWVLRRLKAAEHLQFFILLGYVFTAVVAVWYTWSIAVVPQPHRYQLEMDLALALVLVFLGAAILDRLPPRVRSAAVVVVLCALAFQAVHSAGYAWKLIQPVDHRQLSEFKIAKWLDEHRPGERTFVYGSTTLLFNIFADNPQLHGGHNQHSVSSMAPMVDYTIRTGANAGPRDAEYSVFWLKTFGARTIAVSGPESTEYYRALLNPSKFEGILPVLWREGGDVIYEVPGRTASLAHMMPAAAVPSRAPIHGLDIAPVEAYVKAMDDPAYPPATFEWEGMSKARIRANVARGQVVAAQVTYEQGWEAWANGKRQKVRGDAIGQMVIEPDCEGPCEISLEYTDGTESVITRAMSLSAMMAATVFALLERRRMRCRSHDV